MTALCGLMLCLAALAGTAAANHDFASRCDRCHAPHGMGGTMQVVFPDVDRFCSECHPLPVKHSHPTGVVPDRSAPAGFPLDGQGRLGCSTCHNPHLKPDQSPALLRGTKRGVAFCENCHDEMLGDDGLHFTAVPLAHHQPRTEPGDPVTTQIDSWSRWCIDCHDSVDDHLFCLPETRASCRGHLLGEIYPEDGGGQTRLRPIAQVDPMLSFREGKIGCLTCHTPYGKAPGLLAVDNRGSRLCLNCHNF